MNKARKGYSKEKLAREQLVKDGWFIAFRSIRYRFGTIDFGQCFDIVAYKPAFQSDDGGFTHRVIGERKYISCKHFGNGNYYLPHQEELKQFKEKYGHPGESYELWIWKSPRWQGRGANKVFINGEWIKIII